MWIVLIITTLIIIAANFFFQRQLRIFFIIKLKFENLYKEQSTIFENITDGAIIFSEINLQPDKIVNLQN
jgi:hypothetical protein